jgi:hypothetical protein
MATFRHGRTECQCVDEEVNRRIFWLDSGVPGRVYVYLSTDDAVGIAAQFQPIRDTGRGGVGRSW